MRYAVVSDVHANLEALEAVLADIESRDLEEILFLGDAVGYGPNPNECVALLKERCKIMLAGNHDLAAIGSTGLEYFNEYAKAAILWTQSVLTEKNRRFLGTLPVKKHRNKENVLLVHSTPKEPEEWHYLSTLWDAEINFHYFSERICFIGHSHMPFLIERLPSGEMLTSTDKGSLGKSARYIINAGSVGQPRDRDLRACYVAADDDAVEFVRVDYRREATQRRMHEFGLPRPLIEKLSEGA
ncbi:MAG: metallophosphatase family protein [Nitrospirae bacterium]|nr:metallophosphatase family protein [Nitrospirota bacterium]